jgi:hypothetical protein
MKEFFHAILNSKKQFYLIDKKYILQEREKRGNYKNCHF